MFLEKPKSCPGCWGPCTACWVKHPDPWIPSVWTYAGVGFGLTPDSLTHSKKLEIQRPFPKQPLKIPTCIVILPFSVLSHLPSLFLGFKKQLSSAMHAGGPRLSRALHLMLFLPQDGLWNAISPPRWKQPWEEGRRAPPEQPGSCTPSSYIQSLQVVGVNLGLKAASWAMGNLKWKCYPEKPQWTNSPGVAEISHGSSHRGMTRTKQGELEFSAHLGTIS